MTNDFDYRYDSCISRGICSMNPRTSSLQEVLALYLKASAYYALKLYENYIVDERIKGMILNTISILVSNPQFSETDFNVLTHAYNTELPRLIKEYEEMCNEKGIEPEYLKTVIKYNKELDIINAIQLGEKEFLKKVKELSQETQDLYRILFVIAKSICINVLDLETFEIDSKDGYLMILKILNSLNIEETKEMGFKDLIIEAVELDNQLMKLLRNSQEKRYGKQRVNDVSYTTTPAKAILVVGSNIRELEDVLEAVKDKNIDVYTHDEMMIAHTFPKFSEYKNLKGQYGQGIENCLLDFATFPGPIILTRHSLYNIEHLYRGLLYTTDFASSKGVIPIKNKDFSNVIKAAEDAKGFKTGKQCETVSIGYDYHNSMGIIEEKLSKKEYSHIFIIGLNGYTLEQQTYFDKLLKQTPDDVLIISLSYCTQKENVVCLNACFDVFATVEFAEGLSEKYSIPISVFYPKCDRHTISQMIYLREKFDIEVFIGKCTPIILNPNLINTLNSVFKIQELTSVKKDLSKIL